MLQIIKRLVCDVCEKEIRDATALGSASVLGKDYCLECFAALHSEVDKEYHRVVLKEVPTRRGGHRQLGELDT